MKGIAADARDAIRNCNLLKKIAIPERTYADGRDRISAKRIGQDQLAGASDVCGDSCLVFLDGIGEGVFGLGACARSK